MGRQFGLKAWVFILRAGGSHGRNVSRAITYAKVFYAHAAAGEQLGRTGHSGSTVWI